MYRCNKWLRNPMRYVLKWTYVVVRSDDSVLVSRDLTFQMGIALGVGWTDAIHTGILYNFMTWKNLNSFRFFFFYYFFLPCYIIFIFYYYMGLPIPKCIYLICFSPIKMLSSVQIFQNSLNSTSVFLYFVSFSV